MLYQIARLLDVFEALVPKIRVVKGGVVAALRQQVSVVAFLDDASIFKDQDTVRGLYRRQAMGNQDAGRVGQAVASSRIKIAGRWTRTRSRATSWRWPMDRRAPRSPT